jgi:hypothetical protein
MGDISPFGVMRAIRAVPARAVQRIIVVSPVCPVVMPDAACRTGGEQPMNRRMTMKMFQRRGVRPAAVPVRGMTVAEAMELPAVTDLITAGKALGIGRNKCYALARAGRFPCRVIRAGNSWRVPTVSLLMLLGVNPSDRSKYQDG